MTSSKPQAQAQTETHPINITPMSAIEARECLNAIKSNLESLRLMLLELHRRKGWEALGYASWEDGAMQEFGKSRSYVFRLLAAAEVEENLAASKSTIVDLMDECTIVDLENIPITQLSELAKLPPEQQVEGLLKAEEIAQAQGKKRNATHVVQAVKEIKPKKPTLAQPASADEAKHTEKPKTGWDISPQVLSTTIKGHKLVVDFEHTDNEYFFGFQGPEQTISASGSDHEHWSWNGSKIPKGYLNPGTYADFRAEELYINYQNSLEQDMPYTEEGRSEQSDDLPLSPRLESAIEVSDICITLISTIPLLKIEELKELITSAKEIILEAEWEIKQRQQSTQIQT